MIGSAGYGRGIVVAKLKDGTWSQPCAIETVEVGAGWQVGVSRTHFVIPLNNNSQIDALLSDKGKQVSLSGSMQFAFGKDGRYVKGMVSGSDKSVKRKGGANDKVGVNATVADMQGFDIGVGAAISTIQPLRSVNSKYFYNVQKEDITMSDILNGTIEAPTVIPANDESKLSDEDKLRNKEIDDALVQHTILVSMLSEGMQTSMIAEAAKNDSGSSSDGSDGIMVTEPANADKVTDNGDNGDNANDNATNSKQNNDTSNQAS